MLEKKENLHLMSKLRAILLLEADFNAANKIIFNSRMIPKLEENNLIPQEIVGGRRNQSAIQVAINKKLITDIANQTKRP